MAKKRAQAKASAIKLTSTAARVLLRHPTAADRREYCALRTRNATYFRPWEPRTPEGNEPKPTDTFRRMLKKCDTEACQSFFICLKDTGEIIANVTLNQIFRGPFQNAICGYWIAKEHAGKGYMTEALTVALDHAFGPMKLHRIEANLIPRNARSRNLVKRLGFRFEGLAKRYLQIAGRWQDHEHWAITAEEWIRARNKPITPGRSGKKSHPPARSRTIRR